MSDTPRTPAQVNEDLRQVREKWPTERSAQIQRGLRHSKLLQELKVSLKHHVRSVT